MSSCVKEKRLRPRKAVPSRFASPGGAGVPVTKDERVGTKRQPRTLKVRGFSMIHATDTEASTDGRALLFAEAPHEENQRA